MRGMQLGNFLMTRFKWKRSTNILSTKSRGYWECIHYRKLTHIMKCKLFQHMLEECIRHRFNRNKKPLHVIPGSETNLKKQWVGTKISQKCFKKLFIFINYPIQIYAFDYLAVLNFSAFQAFNLEEIHREQNSKGVTIHRIYYIFALRFFRIE